MRCEGFRRKGGAFALGPVRWQQCENEAVALLKVRQEVIAEYPSCLICWNEAKALDVEILSANPINAAKAEGGA